MKQFYDDNGKMVGYEVDLDKDYGLETDTKYFYNDKGRMVGYEVDWGKTLDRQNKPKETFDSGLSSGFLSSSGYSGPPFPTKPVKPKRRPHIIAGIVSAILFGLLFDEFLMQYGYTIVHAILSLLVSILVGVVIGFGSYKYRRYSYKIKMQAYKMEYKHVEIQRNCHYY